MMTLSEAAQRGIRELWLPHWNPYARLEIDLYADGTYGQFGALIDPASSKAIGFSPETATIVMLIPPEPVVAGPHWEQWQKPADYEEKFPNSHE